MNRASRDRRRRFVTVIVDLARRRPLDIIEGRPKKGTAQGLVDILRGLSARGRDVAMPKR